MKLYQKYIIKELIISFIFSAISFVFIILLTEIFESIKSLIEHNVSILLACKYFILKIPYIFIQILPFALLMSSLYVLTKLIHTNEIIAIKSAGIGNFKISIPLLVFSIFCCILNFLLDETIVPESNFQARKIKEIMFKTKSIDVEKYNVTFKTSSNEIIYAQVFNYKDYLMKNVCIIKLDKNNKIIKRIDAKELFFQNNSWFLKDGIIREFVEGKENVSTFSLLPYTIFDIPADFVKPHRDIKKEMNISQSWQYISKLKSQGTKVTEELLYFYFKFSFPFINLITVLLGISIVFLTGKKLSIISCFGISISLGFIYWGALALFNSLGKHYIIQPLLAAWLANIIFGIAGILLFYQASKRY
jgi:lipopolysaccharide export system permease protein